jgi:YfiR/HmsC-like
VEILMPRRAALSAIAIVLLAARPAYPAGENLEYQVKAAFLFNFLKFVEWPAAGNDSPWVIGVLGHDPFGGVLDQTVAGKIVNGRRVEVHRYARLSEVRDCNILFLGRTDFERMGTPVQPGLLTVGEAPGFLKSGGAINFYLEDNRVHFEIRPEVARSVGLHVSSQLLKLGRTL